jgi:hypothetical protein
VGAAGEGPGEFRSIDQLLVLPGDTILVQDRRLDRLTVFDLDGEFVRTFAVATKGDQPEGQVVGALADGRLVMQRGPGYHVGAVRGGFRRDSMTLYLVDRDGRPAGSVGTFPGSEVHVEVRGRGMTVFVPLLARSTGVIVRGDRIWVADRAGPTLVAHVADGTPVNTIDTGLPVRPVDDADRAAALELRLEPYTSPESRERVRQRLEDIPVPQTMPVFGGFTIDPAGLLWVEPFRVDDSGPSTWLALSPTGEQLASVTFRPGFHLADVRSDAILGRAIDDLDVEYVLRFPLLRH